MRNQSKIHQSSGRFHGQCSCVYKARGETVIDIARFFLCNGKQAYIWPFMSTFISKPPTLAVATMPKVKILKAFAMDATVFV